MSSNKRKKSMLVYMDNVGVYYTIQGKNSDVNGKALFKIEEKDSYGTRIKVLRREVKEIKRKLRVKDVQYVMQEGLRMVKVFKFDKGIKLNNDTEMVLREELGKYMQSSENINDYEIRYLKTDKKLQNTFLTAVVRRKEMMEICNFAKIDKIPLSRILIPEELMHNVIKHKSGIRAVILYDEELLELRVLVGNGLEMLYANQSPNIYASDINLEIVNIMDYIRSKFRTDAIEIIVIGVEPKYLEEDSVIKSLSIEGSEIDSKHIMLKGE